MTWPPALGIQPHDGRSERDGVIDEPENRESADHQTAVEQMAPDGWSVQRKGARDVTLRLCLGQDTQTNGPIGRDFGP